MRQENAPIQPSSEGERTRHCSCLQCSKQFSGNERDISGYPGPSEPNRVAELLLASGGHLSLASALLSGVIQGVCRYPGRNAAVAKRGL
jgi:hypothetical protein